MDELQECLAAIGEAVSTEVPQVKETAATVRGQSDLSALGALAGTKTLSDILPDGEIFCAWGLWRDPDPRLSGEFMCRINIRRNGDELPWNVQGYALCFNRDGHIIDGFSNVIRGHVSKGIPKVNACHLVKCGKCGSVMSVPDAVDAAKDRARKTDPSIKEFSMHLHAWDILDAHGACPRCGGRFTSSEDEEIKRGADFSKRVFDRIWKGGKIAPSFIGPKPFILRPVRDRVDLGKDWSWLENKLLSKGLSAIPFNHKISGTAVVFSPEIFVSVVKNPDDTGLFFREPGSDRKALKRKESREISMCGLGL